MGDTPRQPFGAAQPASGAAPPSSAAAEPLAVEAEQSASQGRPAFGELLRRHRRAAGLSQQALAERADLSVDAIAGLERGRRSAPHADTLRRLVQALELHADDRAEFIEAADPARRRPLDAPAPPAGGVTQPGASPTHSAIAPSAAHPAPPGPTPTTPDARPTSPGAAPVPSGGGAEARAAATPRARAVPRNLPAALSSFVGRADAALALRRLLGTAPPSTRLLTLVGPGGIGKTRLALEVARALADDPLPAAPPGDGGVGAHFGDGVWLAELAALDDPAAVPAAVAAAIELEAGPAPPGLAALARWLAERHLLLVLDNCEHLIDACAHVANVLLRSCPRLVILATSREALSIPGEVVWPVTALSLGSADDPLDGEAVQLFVERATAVRPAFRVTASNAAAVAELCRQLDGIPLAIELAAARVSAFDVETIVARLADRIVLLRSANRLAPPRHQTLEALVQWSYDLLAPAEQHLFARLAVFAGGWDLVAVEAVAADAAPSDTRSASTIDVLARLVDKSLVVRGADRAGNARYALLETLRQFAMRALGATHDGQTLRERHARYYLTMLQQAEPDIEGPQQAERLQQLEQDIDNIRAALDWCSTTDHAEPALEVAWCLAVLAWLRGYLEEMDGRLSALLDRPSGQQAAPAVRARGLVATGYVCFYRGQLERAHRLVEAGLALFRQLGLARETGQALVWFGLIRDAEADLDQARQCFVEALQLFRTSGDAFWTARAATNLGRCLGRLGDVAGAVPLLEEALALRRQLGDRRGVANTLHHLADALESSGQLTQARALAAEALGIAQAVGDRFVTVRAYIGLARVAYALDDLRLADEHLARAMAVAQRDGFGHEMAEVAILQGLVARQTGEPTRARALAELALCTARQHSRRLEAARALWLLGSLAAADARLDEARGWLGESLALYQQAPDPTGVALASRTLALLDGDDAAVAAVPGGPPAGWTIEQHELGHLRAQPGQG